MKVQFVSSINSGLSPIVVSQMNSLKDAGMDISTYGIEGKGILGYLKNVLKLWRIITVNSPDVIHAHYSFCGIVASLSSRKPVVCSLMGSDVMSSGLWRIVVKFFAKHVWAATIVKSEDMRLSLGLSNVSVIPNGVDVSTFIPMDKALCRKRLEWDCSMKIVLFASNPARKEKNFAIAKVAIQALNNADVELKIVYNVTHEEMPVYLNAADVMLLTSLWEGSPNVVKETMACNTPVVSTDVGDVKWLLDGVDGSYIVTNNLNDISDRISKSLAYSGHKGGRDRLINLKLDSFSVAEEIINLYKRTIV